MCTSLLILVLLLILCVFEVGSFQLQSLKIPHNIHQHNGHGLGCSNRQNSVRMSRPTRMMMSVVEKSMKNPADYLLDEVVAQQDGREEQVHRGYTTEGSSLVLPKLADCDNYYSGVSGDFFWHQNSDQVFVFFPIDDTIGKEDVDATFAARYVRLRIKGREEISFPCVERIIPEGSFWVMERDPTSGQRYVMVDLEKRFRMINWKNLFGNLPAVSDSSKKSDDERRAEMMEKLMGLNSKSNPDFNSGPDSGDGDGGSGKDLSSMAASGELAKLLGATLEEAGQWSDAEGKDQNKTIVDAELV